MTFTGGRGRVEGRSGGRRKMGDRGPAPKATALKLIAGKPGKRELNLDEAIPDPMASVEAPGEVSSDPRAKAIWDRLVPDLAKCGLARSVDGPLLTRYCLKLSRWIFLGEEIRRISAENPSSKGTTYPITEGYEETGADGKKIKRERVKYVAEFPWASEWRTLDRDLRADERALGISPAARSRITVKGEGRKTEDDLRRDFFKRGSFLAGDKGAG